MIPQVLDTADNVDDEEIDFSGENVGPIDILLHRKA